MDKIEINIDGDTLVTLEEEFGEDKSSKIADTIKDAISLYVKARELKAISDEKIKEIVVEAEDLLAPILAITEIEKMKFLGIGTLAYKIDPESHSFDKTVLKQTLALSGVSAVIIAKAMKAADIVTQKEPYKITFTKEKKKK